MPPSLDQQQQLLVPLLQPDRSLRDVEGKVWSTLPDGTSTGSYDGRAHLYDAIVGSRLYNRLLWGARTDSYRAFARRALADGSGPVLDAGSGSAVFTAEAYADVNRPVVLVDRSLGMLNTAQGRISKPEEGELSTRRAFVQADLFDLPFRSGTFSDVLSMGMLHLFEAPTELVRVLLDTVASGGRLYLTSLVTDRAVGQQYLTLLHRTGEVAPPRSFAEVRATIEAASESGDVEAWREGNMAFFVVSKAQ